MTDSLQSTEPLKDFSISGGANSASSANWLSSKDEDFDLDQPYQRGSVWGRTRQRLLIKSLIMGLPIPAIMINERNAARFDHYSGAETERNYAYAVVDGKQRVQALRAFFHNDLAVPASWFIASEIESTVQTADGTYVFFEGLTRARRRDLLMSPVAVVRAKLPTLEAESEIFDLLNFGGVAQGDSDFED